MQASARVGGEVWRVEGDGLELELSRVGEARAIPSDDAEPVAVESLAQASGSFTVDGERHEVDCLGWNEARVRLLEGDWGSVHHVAAWFASDHGLALGALYPPEPTTHDQGTVTAAVLDAEGSPVEDPRLSTTYRPDGEIIRAGIELWLVHDEEEQEVFPLRASGEAVGPHLGWTHSGVTIDAEPFRWHSREREGAGIYLRGRR
jgi:hypothetical protein